MSVLRPRNRLVNFRLSEDEFERLRSSCEAFGARSISDFARTSVLDRLEQSPPPAGNTTHAFGLGDKVAALEARVGQILNLLEATGSATPGPGGYDRTTDSGHGATESGSRAVSEGMPVAASFDW